jgi:hypothetical protein
MTNFRLALDIPSFPQKINHRHKLFLSGSCFTEHITKQLSHNKFTTIENPNGILFNPASIAASVVSYTEQKLYSEEDLFYYNELWNSWDHHSRFSHPDKQTALQQINNAQQAAHAFLKQADWLILTLGSAFVYEWIEKPSPLYPVKNRDSDIVANCHKVPANRFRKRLLTTEEVFTVLDNLRYRLMLFNPAIKVIYTISPVRHARDGLVENNKSKAILIQAVHHMVEKFENHFYFPAYELVIDDLRDYRFYAEDMVHPNYLATAYVWEKFTAACIDPRCYALMKEMEKINIAVKHRPFNPASAAHRQFLSSYLTKVQALQDQYPYLNFTEELKHFGGN